MANYLTAVKDAIWNWGRDHRDDLESLNRWVSHTILRAEQGMTISGNAWLSESKGKSVGKWLRPKIDALFMWGINQKDHCHKAYLKDIAFIEAQKTA